MSNLLLRQSRSPNWMVTALRILACAGKTIAATRGIRALMWVACLVLAIQSAGAATPEMTVPEGFIISRVAGAPAVRFPMFACFDDAGNLFVTESSGLDLYAELQKQTRLCRISRLTDHDANGQFEQAQVFAEQLVFPMGLAWRDDKLYVADPPDLITLEDTDGDGRADKRTVVLSGFGHTDNGSLHGLTFGPDGWLYMTMGSPDGYQLKGAGGSVLSGKSGVLLRCRPDGSAIEVVSRGFENLVEVVFLPGGEIIGTDNWFSLPAAGVRDALVHLIEGGLYPLGLKDQGTTQFVNEPLPPVTMYPAVAHSGIVRYHGAAFPEHFRDTLFSAQFNARKIVQHQLQRTNSTFRTVDQDFVVGNDPDFHPSDILEDADGSLLIIDTGSWYVQHCPTGRIRKAPATGAIYRVQYDLARGVKDPRDSKRDWARANTAELARLLLDERPVVRRRVARELIRRKGAAVKPIAELLRASPSYAREEAIWALAQIGDTAALEVLREQLAGDNPGSIALAARALGRAADDSAGDALNGLLKHPEQHVRLAAAEALAHCGNKSTVATAFSALTEEPDRFLEHALLYSLHRLATPSQLADALKHSNARVQKAALILLNQPPFDSLDAASVLARLFSEDDALRRTARSILSARPDWAKHVVPLIQNLFAKPRVSSAERETLEELLLAFTSQPEVARLVADGVSGTRTNLSNELRLVLLQSMARAKLKTFPQPWLEALKSVMVSGSDEIRLSAIQTAKRLRLRGLVTELTKIAREANMPPRVRLEALQALVRERAQLDPPEFALLLTQLDRQQSPVTRLAALEVALAAVLVGEQMNRFVEAVTGDPIISPGAVVTIAQRAQLQPENTRKLCDYFAENVRAGWQMTPEQLAWLESVAAADQKARVTSLRRAIDERRVEQIAELTRLEPLLAGGRADLGRNLFFEKAVCVACHRIKTEGGTIGPDLSRIGAIRAGRDLIESVLLPNATFAQGYETYRVVLKNGDDLTGIRARQADDGFVLRDTSGADYRLEPEQIERVERSQVSIMPEGLFNALSQDEIRDLLAYLQSLK